MASTSTHSRATAAASCMVLALACILAALVAAALHPAAADAQETADIQAPSVSAAAELAAFAVDSAAASQAPAALPLTIQDGGDDPVAKAKYRPLSGTVYFSYADLAKGTAEMKQRNTFATAATGDEAGKLLWHVPVDLAQVSAIDLDDYGLGDYKMPAQDPDASYQYETTVLQLLVYANERWFGTDVSMAFCRDKLLEHAGVVSAFGRQMTPYSFQEPGQLDFLVDGKLTYPDLTQVAGNYSVFGGTPAVVPLQSDQSVDFVRFPYAALGYNMEKGTYAGSYAFRPGIREFVDGDGVSVYTESALEGVPKTLRITGVGTIATARFGFGETWPENGNIFIREQYWDGDFTTGKGTPEPIFVDSEYGEGCPIYWGRTYGEALGTARTDAEGVLSIVFPEPGTYYVWSDAVRTFNGGYSANSTDVFYVRTGFNDASPALCTVEVGANPVAPTLPETINPVYLGELANQTLALGGWPVPSVSLAAGSLPPGLNVDTSGAITGVPAERGTFTFTLRAENDVEPADERTYTMEVLGRAPQVSSGLQGAKLPQCDVGFPYYWPINASGSPEPDVVAHGLPRGLRYDAELQAIVGTPEETGVFTVTLIASNGVGADGRPDNAYSNRAQLELRVDSREVRIYTDKLPDVVIDQDYAAFLDGGAVNGDELTWSLAQGSALPEGLVLSQDGTISGIMHEAGTYTFAAVASDNQGNSSDPVTLSLRCKSKYRPCAGKTYLTITYMGSYVVSNGSKAGVPMRFVPIDMAQVCAIDLDEWTDASGESLGRYNMDAQDPDADYVYECTLLQLFVYASELYSSGGGNSLDISGPFGSTWLGGGGILDLGGEHNGNLFYYVNGRYPLEYEGWGSVSNTTALYPGDFVDICTWEPGGIGDSSTFGGFYYFMDGDEPTTGEFSHGIGEPVHEYAATAGAGLDVRVATPATDVRQHTVFNEAAGKRVYWGTRYGKSSGYVDTGADGTAHIDFPAERCRYYLWTVESKYTPAYATVDVRLDGDDPSTPVYPVPDVEGYLQDFACGTVGQPFTAKLDLGDTWAGSAVELYETSHLPQGLELLPDGTVRGVPLEGGAFEIHGKMERAKNTGEFLVRLVIWETMPTFADAELPDGTEKEAYAAALQAAPSCIVADVSGNAADGFAVRQLVYERGSAQEGDDASWLSWDEATGALTGTPPAGAKTYTLAVRARADISAVAEAWLAGRIAYIDWQCDIGRITKLKRASLRNAARAEAQQVAEEQFGGYDTGWVKIPVQVHAVRTEGEPSNPELPLQPVQPAKPVAPAKASLASAAVTVAAQTYTSHALTPAPAVRLGGKALKAGTDYTVSYKNNVEVGTATVTVAGKGSYTGAKSVTFKINHRVTTKTFKDLKAGQWYMKDTAGKGAFNGTKTLFLDYMVARGILSGSNGKLQGDGAVTRGQLAVMLYRAEKGRDATAAENRAKTKFKDVKKGKYYTAAVKWASDNKIVTGYTSGKNKGRFLPDAKVTRQDLALMVQRYAKMKGAAASGRALSQKDRGKVSGYAKAAMQWAASANALHLRTAKAPLSPKAAATRAEAAQMIAVALHDTLGRSK